MDVEEFSRHFEELRPLLERYALRFLPCADDAADVVSDVWLRAIDRIDAYAGLGPKLLYLSLRQSCRFMAGWLTDRRRRHSEAQLFEPSDMGRHSLDFSLAGLLCELELRQRPLAIALATGYTYEETAAILGLSVEAVKTRTHRLRKQLHHRGLDTRPLWWVPVYRAPRGMADRWHSAHPGGIS